MKVRERERLAKKVLPPGMEFEIIQALCVALPMHNVLRGICFDSSDDPKVFYVTYFLQPLYVPSDVIHFTFGDRLSGWWKSDMDDLVPKLSAAIRNEAVPLLERVNTPEGVAAELRRIADKVNPHTLEARSYALIQIDDVHGAIASLHELLESIDRTIDWHIEIRQRAELIRNLLVSEPSKAMKQMRQWEQQTIHNLKLERLTAENA